MTCGVCNLLESSFILYLIFLYQGRMPMTECLFRGIQELHLIYSPRSSLNSDDEC